LEGGDKTYEKKRLALVDAQPGRLTRAGTGDELVGVKGRVFGALEGRHVDDLDADRCREQEVLCEGGW
jgi:hypothetical protein